MFSVVNAVLRRPSSYSHPQRIGAIDNVWRQSGVSASVSAPDFHDRHDTTTSAPVAGAADYATVVRATPGFFKVFGVGPAIGRVLETADETPGSPLRT